MMCLLITQKENDMTKSDFRSGQYLTHKNLGTVYIDEGCLVLNAVYGDSTSCFVVHDGETKEVSIALIVEK